jgi:hypothetical protein
VCSGSRDSPLEEQTEVGFDGVEEKWLTNPVVFTIHG